MPLTLALLLIVTAAAGGLAGGFALGRRTGGRASRVARTAAPTQTVADLTDLKLRAKVRGDFETAGLIDRLQTQGPRLAECETDAAADATLLTTKMRRMYDNAVEFCDKALSLHVARREMATDAARQKVDEQRRALLDEASAAVSGIESGVDRLRSAAATGEAEQRRGELADLNADLDRRLEVARRVDERMADLEARARGDYSASAAYVKDHVP